MNNNPPVRVRVKFAKHGDLRFTGHLDLQRLFERALRRSGLPLRFSQGFNPKVRLSLASALPLGFSSEAELLDFWLDEQVDIPLIKQNLDLALPNDISVRQIELVSNQLPSLQSSLIASEYRVSFFPEGEPQKVAEKLSNLLDQENILFTRRTKTVNYKNLILAANWLKTPQGLDLLLRMKSTPDANGRPDELLRLLGLTPGSYQVCRTALIFSPEEMREDG
ncbi:MAG TPA: TIGR03936 family radical SAM-associated protein [Anaerolineaceae bacterium]|jgi:radical SAM-linked protein|nr:TIGR03936 family radical SAM-associated protein [Anaerolineaceae bacterium]NMD26974.1 DUF2344 domain-containing protein [Chloroflexota bacterium]HOA21824.1 TIGR03936 family radical SAM-associated protein [Anaerolineaceae bacterium]HOG76804.1 TIGR03936 family radical SAM-associated protein [Anaerolineaceae bacterium]